MIAMSGISYGSGVRDLGNGGFLGNQNIPHHLSIYHIYHFGLVNDYEIPTTSITACSWSWIKHQIALKIR
jgi:hypothetical protein